MKKREFLKLTGVLGAGVVVAPFMACTEAAKSEVKSKDPEKAVAEAAVTIFTLPELGYAFDALAPSIDAQTMEIHHGKHHAGYVKKLNAALAESTGFGGLTLKQILANVSADQTGVRNNGGGHYNHSLYWKAMAPGGGNAPEGALLDAINAQFGSTEKFIEEFSTAAKTRFGSGWAWLYVTSENKLAVCSTPNQDNPLMSKIAENQGTPILGIDVWEHAYYLNYQNKRGDYIGAFTKLINWSQVSANLAAV
jgi:superoxide dismutase, Fe-Mn family